MPLPEPPSRRLLLQSQQPRLGRSIPGWSAPSWGPQGLPWGVGGVGMTPWVCLMVYAPVPHLPSRHSTSWTKAFGVGEGLVCTILGPAGPSMGGGGGWHDAMGVFWSAAGGANWPITTCCPSLGPFPSVGGGAHLPLTSLCPSPPSLAYLSLSTSLSFPLVGCAFRGGGGAAHPPP